MPWRSRVRAGRELAVSFAALLAVGALIYSANSIVNTLLPAARAEDAANADALWRVQSTQGDAFARRSDGGDVWYPVRVGQALEPGSEIKTETSARVALVRGTEILNIDPNKRVALPSRSRAPQTLIIQWFGEVIYDVAKRPAPSFEVDTPHLVAVVKGTKFSVKVDDDGSSVSVTEGLVSVAAEGNSDNEVDVGTGSKATVLTAAPMDVAVGPVSGSSAGNVVAGSDSTGNGASGGNDSGLGGGVGGDGYGEGDGDGDGDGEQWQRAGRRRRGRGRKRETGHGIEGYEPRRGGGSWLRDRTVGHGPTFLRGLRSRCEDVVERRGRQHALGPCVELLRASRLDARAGGLG
jgi:hypothetical protein